MFGKILVFLTFIVLAKGQNLIPLPGVDSVLSPFSSLKVTILTVANSVVTSASTFFSPLNSLSSLQQIFSIPNLIAVILTNLDFSGTRNVPVIDILNQVMSASQTGMYYY